jgi:tripartite-type tricarboxylate transporter receptor subunit TctC
MQRRQMLACGLAAAMAPLARADDFPSRPITLVVTFPAGTVTDNVTRVIAKAMSQSLGQPVLVDNKSGAQGTIGAAQVAHGAKPDGYTLLIGSSGMYVARSMYKTLSYDPMGSFVPVAGMAATAMMFLVPAASPIRAIGDLARIARQANPPVTMGYGSPTSQVAVALFATVSESQPIAVSYRGIPQAITDMLGGQVQVAVADVGNALMQVNAGKARALAISSSARYDGAPDVPTLQEAFPGASGGLETVIAMQAPAGTPAAVVQKLDDAVRAALDTQEVKDSFRAMNAIPLPLNARQLAARLQADNPRGESLMKKAGIEPQ